MRFVMVWTMMRGVLEVPELLDDANQGRAFQSADAATAQQRWNELRRGRGVQSERDPMIGAREQDRLTRGAPGCEQVDKMVRLAAHRRAG